MSVDDETPDLGATVGAEAAATPEEPGGDPAPEPNADDLSAQASGVDAGAPSAGDAEADAGGALAAELAAMANAIERFHGRADQYESIIRRMQTRIEELQGDQVRELFKPVIVKLASLHTGAVEAEVQASARDDDSARKDFDYFVSEIEEALSLLDVESVGVSVIDEFDPAKHAARRRIDTDDPSLDRRVAKVLRQGFTFVGAERVFLPAMVNVYRYVPSEESETAATEASTTTN